MERRKGLGTRKRMRDDRCWEKQQEGKSLRRRRI